MVSPPSAVAAVAVKPGSETDEASLQEARGLVRTLDAEDYEDDEASEASARAKRQRRLDLSSQGSLEENNGRDDEAKESSYSPPTINLAEASLAPFVLQNPPQADDPAAALSALIREHGRNQMHNNINTDQNNAGTNGNGINNINNAASNNPAAVTQLLMAQLELQRLQQQQPQGQAPPQQPQQQPRPSPAGPVNHGNNMNSSNPAVNVQQLIMNAQLLQQQQQQLNLLAALGRAQQHPQNPQQQQQNQHNPQQQQMYSLAVQQMLQQQNQYTNLMAMAAQRGGMPGAIGSPMMAAAGGMNMGGIIPGMQQVGLGVPGMPGFVSQTSLGSVGSLAGSQGGGRASNLPAILAQPDDNLKLSTQQVFLRHQIEAFRACEDDILTHTRGRNKPVAIGQVGIRCRYCSHLQVARRQKGSTYFPASLNGLYQAAQNMNTSHMSSGICTEMPLAVKQEFARLNAIKEQASAAGRPYWANSAATLGLVDTEDGIRHMDDVRARAAVLGVMGNGGEPSG